MDLVDELDPVTDVPVSVAEGIGGPPPQVDEALPAADAPLSLRANRDFRVVVLGQGISAVGDAVSATALPLLVLALTGSGLQMGIVAVLQRLPDLLLGLPAGAFADRWDRRRMMMWADAGRAVLTALVPLASLLGFPVMGTVLLVAFPINAFRVVFMAGWTAAVPNLVGRSQLARATGIFEALGGASFIVGPAIAGILVAWIGAAPTLVVDAASFAVSAVSLTLVRRPLRRAERRPPMSLRHEMAEGVRFILGHPVMRDLIGFWTFVSLISAPIIEAAAYYLTIDRPFGPSGFGLILSAYSVGSLVGALLAGRIVRGFIAPHLLIGNLIVGVAVVGIALTSSLPVMAVLAVVAGTSQSIVLVAYVTVRAASSPDELLGRVGSTARTISVGIQPLGLLAGGILLDVVHGAATLLVIAVGTVLTSLVFAFSPGIRRAHAVPHAYHSGT